MAEVPAFVDEYAKGRAGRALIDKLPNPAHVLRHPLGTPDHDRELARHRHELGSPVLGLVLELRRHHGAGPPVADDQVGAQRPAGSCQHRVVVQHQVGQPALTDYLAQMSLHGPDQVTLDPEVELAVVLAKPVHRFLDERRSDQRKVIHPTPLSTRVDRFPVIA